MNRADGERGVTLVEVMVALVMVTVAGLATVEQLGAAIRHIRLLTLEEDRIDSAHRALSAMTLLRRAELDRRIGSHPVGEFVVAIQRPDPELYRIAVSELRMSERPLLVTVLYRPRRERP